MSVDPAILWLSPSRGFLPLDRPLLVTLSRQHPTLLWQYQQTADEPSSLAVAVALLGDYLNAQGQPVHLAGHGLGGTIAFLAAAQYPRWVASVAMLSVGFNLTLDWQYYFYQCLVRQACHRTCLLRQLLPTLFAMASLDVSTHLALLEADLWTSPSPHSLYQTQHLYAHRLPMPLFVARGWHDPVITPANFRPWRSLLKPQDCLWWHSAGSYFFHYTHKDSTAAALLDFWRGIRVTPPAPGQVQTPHLTGN